MRAGRLVNMVLILQHKGRVTAAALSQELGVTTRTVLRDVQALHEAGIPIYTSQGSGGGIDLVAGFRTILTGLATDEATALLLLGQPALARQLGLAGSAEAARRKVLEALTPELRRRATELDQWFLHDPHPWTGRPPEMLDRLASAIRRSLVAELTFDGAPIEVRPLGLVAKAGRWHLVQVAEPDPVAVALDGLRSVRVTRTEFARPTGFDLSITWDTIIADGEQPPTVRP